MNLGILENITGTENLSISTWEIVKAVAFFVSKVSITAEDAIEANTTGSPEATDSNDGQLKSKRFVAQKAALFSKKT